jgi:hemerythrin
MERAAYPVLADHRQQHRRLREQVEGLRGRFESGDPSIVHELMALLGTWLVEHIGREDRAYVAAVRAAGAG